MTFRGAAQIRASLKPLNGNRDYKLSDALVIYKTLAKIGAKRAPQCVKNQLTGCKT
tara:strand:+ start:185 stop:352 length:168 start_codon:yes stop_codon:yes gene_type:complete